MGWRVENLTHGIKKRLLILNYTNKNRVPVAILTFRLNSPDLDKIVLKAPEYPIFFPIL